MSDLLAPPQPIISVRVHSQPAPQGSKHARPIYRGKGEAKVFTGQVAQVESSAKVKPWREAVKAAVLDARPPSGLVDTPVTVRVEFIIDRPKSHYRTGRNSGLLRESAPKVPAYKPDLDKLIRSTLDALKDSYVYRDDSQIVAIDASKVYASAVRGGPGAEVRVWHWRERTQP